VVSAPAGQGEEQLFLGGQGHEQLGHIGSVAAQLREHESFGDGLHLRHDATAIPGCPLANGTVSGLSAVLGGHTKTDREDDQMSNDNGRATMPSDVEGEIGFFDRFAGGASEIASRAPFFAFCVLLIIVWAPSIAFLKVDTWQLIINTATTIITFLMVALLQNSQTRTDQATQHKLNAIADGLADLMVRVAERYEDPSLHDEVHELKLAVGLEGREGTAQKKAPTEAGMR
jgi:hypothetical protein